MKYLITASLLSSLVLSKISGQTIDTTITSINMHQQEIIKTESHIAGLKIAITHNIPPVLPGDYPVLFLHGSSFPTALSFGFMMGNTSWMDNLTENGYDVYALDFLGYGNSDRYPEMEIKSSTGKPVGRAIEVYRDVEKAVNLILQKTGKEKIYLIGHSWGGSVGALYASKFPGKIAALVLFATITVRNDPGAIENVESTYETLTPAKRIQAMENLTPAGRECQLEKKVFESWGNLWLKSDPLSIKFKSDSVRFPSGPSQDIEDLKHNKPYYYPADIKAPTLIIRGEWDKYPNNTDCETLFSSLENAASKKYVVIERGTHVMHLEKSRNQLYDEVLYFLKKRNENQNQDKNAIAVIFEVIPKDDSCKQEYLDIAASLKPELEKIKGFISIERFQSIYHPEKILSLSFWENENAIRQWRNLETHRAAQTKGREYIFKDYRLRIARLIRNYGMYDRLQAPADSRSFHK